MRNIPLSPSSAQQLPLRLWHSQTATIARFILMGYIKSGWILGDIVFLWLLYAIFFLSFGSNVAYFYGTAGPGLAILAILGTVIMTQRAFRARMYLPLSRLSSRSTYIFGLIVATGILRVFSFLLILLLAASYHSHAPGLGIQDATIANMLPGAIGVLLYTILLSTLTILLSPPVATRGMQICFLAWLAAVLYSNTGPGLVARYLNIVSIPLTPIATCYGIGMTETLDIYSFIMLLLTLCFIVGLCWLCAYCFKRRDLIVH